MPAPEPIVSEAGQLLYPWKHEWPRYLIFFGHLLKQEGVKTYLEGKGYKERAANGKVKEIGWAV